MKDMYQDLYNDLLQKIKNNEISNEDAAIIQKYLEKTFKKYEFTVTMNDRGYSDTVDSIKALYTLIANILVDAEKTDARKITIDISVDNDINKIIGHKVITKNKITDSNSESTNNFLTITLSEFKKASDPYRNIIYGHDLSSVFNSTKLRSIIDALREHRLICYCDKCNNGKIITDISADMCRLSYPPTYTYICDTCGHMENLYISAISTFDNPMDITVHI